MNKTNNNDSLVRQIFVSQTKGFIDISQKELFWKELADELSGVFTIKHTISRDLELLCLQIPYQDIYIEFTESDTQPLKINCILNAKQKIQYSVSTEDTVDKHTRAYVLLYH